MTAKDVLSRAVKTFVQAFLGALPATLALNIHGIELAGYVSLTAGVAALLSLAHNLALSLQA